MRIFITAAFGIIGKKLKITANDFQQFYFDQECRKYKILMISFSLNS